MNGAAYQGKIVAYIGAGTRDTAYQFFDASGNTMFYVGSQNADGLFISFPSNAKRISSDYSLPTGTVVPPYYGTGTFSQTKGGSTISGALQACVFSSWTADASQSDYWSAH